ncbi:DnaA ATPase domain-containing protein [Desulfitobacterium sp.]|uniref:DnaA ATPase domain-containing protein n=1 Tax=Desulfitobacterium sp. TaxID=49981 RepID=UPI002C65B073|nr:DnaA/Hda family protein [Desulfitobacterium sp.]HVJ48687.1 DnaA/Hda family protein [Desulfitobacterium sp.]
MEPFISHFNRLAVDTLRHYIPEQAQPITLIYGPTGVGKTELLRTLYRQHKNPQVLLIDALTFSQNYAFAAQEGSLNDFRLHMRTLKLIILDRLEILKGKKHTLEELLHTLDALVSQGGKVVTSFQGEPQELAFMGTKLSSRFLGGMTIPVFAPSPLELEDYANRYARSRFLLLPEAILQSIAEQTSSLVEVQKLIKDFGLFSGNCGENQDVELTEEYWQDFLETQRKRREAELTSANILRKVTELTGVLPEDIRGNSRAAAPLASRRLAVYAIRKLCVWSYPQLGEYFQRAHSVMIKSYHQFEEMMKEDPDWRKKFEILQDYFDQDKG